MGYTDGVQIFYWVTLLQSCVKSSYLPTLFLYSSSFLFSGRSSLTGSHLEAVSVSQPLSPHSHCLTYSKNTESCHDLCILQFIPRSDGLLHSCFISCLQVESPSSGLSEYQQRLGILKGPSTSSTSRFYKPSLSQGDYRLRVLRPLHMFTWILQASLRSQYVVFCKFISCISQAFKQKLYSVPHKSPSGILLSCHRPVVLNWV